MHTTATAGPSLSPNSSPCACQTQTSVTTAPSSRETSPYAPSRRESDAEGCLRSWPNTAGGPEGNTTGEPEPTPRSWANPARGPESAPRSWANTAGGPEPTPSPWLGFNTAGGPEPTPWSWANLTAEEEGVESTPIAWLKFSFVRSSSGVNAATNSARSQTATRPSSSPTNRRGGVCSSGLRVKG